MVNQKLLSQYQSIKAEIKELDYRIEELYFSAMFPKSGQITGLPRAAGYSTEGLAKLFEQIENLVAVYVDKRIKLIELCLEIENEVDSLPSVERRIIRLRYLDGKEWSDISTITTYSVSQLHKIHKKIFQNRKDDTP